MASVASQLIEEVTAHAQRDSLEDAREICADGTYFPNNLPDAVDTAVCAPDDRWWHHPKHVEQFPDKMNRVTLHFVGYILDYSYDARIHER